MKKQVRTQVFSGIGLVALCIATSVAGAQRQTVKTVRVVTPNFKIDFNREVRPILSQNCFKCHGPDENQRQVGLRLDTPTGGRKVFASGEFVRRIFATDATQMPPPHANKTLTIAQKETLRRWVLRGATYAPHWAFVAPKAPPLLGAEGVTIDGFVRARLALEGLSPSPEADRYTLVRRLSLDLIGLPPTVEETDAFVSDTSPRAYEKLVDRLLSSPHYGEKWARKWLDLARYADTNGYEKDRPRTMWLYRDWVINALNADMPFDQFTLKQIAGDMLPNANTDDKIATGFHRNTMLNEEGGIDPLEFRFHSMTDRVATTGTTWLGLTVGCAQCHTHKFDPITHTDYYRFLALMNNTEEPEIEVESRENAKKRTAILAEVAEREADLPSHFPLPSHLFYHPLTPATSTASSGATLTPEADGSLLATGTNPDTDTYNVVLKTPIGAKMVSGLQLEALTDPSLGRNGPGRTPHGNFVLTEITGEVNGIPLKFSRAEADFSQQDFPPSGAIDKNPRTGWAIAGANNSNVNRTATFYLDKPMPLPEGAEIKIKLSQEYGGQHTIGKFRLSFVEEKTEDARSIEIQRKEAFESAFASWKAEKTKTATHWTILKPDLAKSEIPKLTILPDNSIIALGDMSKRDIYDVKFVNIPQNIMAIRLEALPDKRLPKNGPGRIFYEGTPGNFILTELNLESKTQPIALARAVATAGNPNDATDNNPLTGWSIGDKQGQTQVAVFRLKEPLIANEFTLKMLFEFYYACGLGRFRVSVTTDSLQTGIAALPPEIEEILALPENKITVGQDKELRRYFCQTTPNLQAEREVIASLKRTIPTSPTALVFAERPADNPRPTFRQHRGEFLQPKETVTPGTFSFLPNPNATNNRLALARWLVGPTNPLTARVIVNRQWSAFFGRGIVATENDFGYQGDMPSHPELLDYLAVRFQTPTSQGGLGWSLKKLHRLIVTSATYKQTSRSSPLSEKSDAKNILLSRGPRVRLDAELIRDNALRTSGLLSEKRGGPSVFPPQQPNITTEGTYGPLTWTVSTGEDRYRRGLYTFAKRSAPYALFTTFDAGSGEACLARRDVSNTPLQALTLLNNEVFVEAAQHLGKIIATRDGTLDEKTNYLFRRVLTRPPTQTEIAQLTRFYTAQRARFEKKELDAKIICGSEGSNAQAAWTSLARVLLNLDETIVKR